MIQTINPKFGSLDKAKTAEIMSRYRPIAPKPETPTEESAAADTSVGLPLGIRRSPYLMAVWHELQARPTRTRKRGKTLGPPVPESKRSRFNCSPPLSFVPSAVASAFPPVLLRNLHPMKCGIQIPVTASSATVSAAPPVVEVPLEVDVPTEVDLVRQLEKMPSKVSGGVISPTAVRPVGSSIMVGMITVAKKCRSKSCGARFSRKMVVLMKKSDVERELELERLPAVVSDSEHRVRLTNPAYNEMVGQPECPWLDIDIGRRTTGGGASACRRIGGEVVLKMANNAKVGSSDAFTSWVRIEWGKKKEDGKMENAVNAYCEAVRLACDSDDYFIQWRFHVEKDKKEASDHHSAA